MNSSQLNFFFVAEDWPNIRDFLHQHSIELLQYRATNADKIIWDEIHQNDQRLPYKLGLTQASYKDEIVYEYDEKKTEYELDPEKSYVIEFDTGGFYPHSAKVLHRARFYCVFNFYARRGELVTKNEDFKKWVKKFYRSYRKRFLVKLGESTGIMTTENTLQWMKENNAQIDGGYLSISIK